ncbi:hypothetical protein JG688_00010737 [Phytophthora aleatoria]|uniref:WRKY19-like zinc finger domain-containing protein n=1 Tax=Phytophthora aleatoria TaxID=2496075 RepID=A0A8J5M350_9STRA|nr:hypothetical protein JG688_00010737 [Phytophthora aleatoria]
MAQPGSNSTSLPASSNADISNVNPELLRSMMDCVDTTLFSPAQLANWTHMKPRLTSAVEHKTPVSLTTGDLAMVKTEFARNEDFRQPLHREASIQDVLACLLDQQPPSARLMSSQNAGGSFLVSSENAKQEVDSKPSLKKLLSSNDFSMTEKKESLRHLLSFIDNSFASNTPEPLTQVYKDCEAGTLQRLSSLQLMRSFMTPNSQNAGNVQANGGMGMRTTSFEIIQAMLNATSNQAIQKPMTSQDSFRFQHLARTLESIETDVSAIDNEDYGGDDVVQVDNLDNLLDYHGSNGTSAANTPGAALLSQKQQMRGLPQQQMRISTQNGKPIKTDANGTQLCSALGCNHAARVKGMCKLHGGGRRCKVDGCMKSAQTGHLCIAHGGGKPCNVEGCPKTAQSRGLCKQHGGGVRCKFEGCTKSCQSGGFCRGHGGGKRCEYPNCTKWAQKNGHCAKHAQEIAAQQLQQQQAMQAQMQQQLVHP